jgi:hypothetical protein
MAGTADQRRRVRKSAIVLGLFAVALYVAFIVYSVKSHG